MVSSPIQNNNFKYRKAWWECWSTPRSYYKQKLLKKIITSFFNRYHLPVVPRHNGWLLGFLQSLSPLEAGAMHLPCTDPRAEVKGVREVARLLAASSSWSELSEEQWKEQSDGLSNPSIKGKERKSTGKCWLLLWSQGGLGRRRRQEESKKEKAHVCVHVWSTCCGVRC